MTVPSSTAAVGVRDAARAPARARWLALLVLALTFVAGGAVGWAVGHRAAGAGWSGGPGGHRGGGGPSRGRGMMPPAVMERLGLAPAQQHAIDSILDAHRGQVEAFWQGPGRQLRVILDSTRADVRTVLTPAQRALLDSAEQAERARRERMSRERFGRGAARGGSAGALDGFGRGPWRDSGATAPAARP